ncbi:flavin reductase family protein [Clostridium oryzae]|uniref:Flavoredoxin n=1 Tax=Clostridium oryzae TaxID=1450648 RepID=A0A1V4IPX8_9CLOT|nr:flavin reductase family protein [Clostridium oryzae]OPJ62101.1 flavoredoxin [Clostridium oryzae]
MNKVNMGNISCLYPIPTVLVGARVNNVPNYLNVSYCGIVNRTPAMISISLNRYHYTCNGIEQNKTFSVNIPSAEMVEVTDYCGIVSGKNVDKSKLFNSFYGSLDVPMIEECPINMECKVIKELDLGGSNIIYIGEIVQAYSEEKYFTDGKPDMKKINPIMLSLYEFNYYNVGEKIGKGWETGKNYCQ